MKKTMLAAVCALAGVCGLSAAEVLLEEDFAFATPGTTMPQGFRYYSGTQLPKGQTPNTKAEVRKYQDGCELVFDDQCEKTGIGLQYGFTMEPGAEYRATVTGAVLPGRNSKNVHVQLSAGKARKAVALNAPADGSEVTRHVDFTAPAGVSSGNLHVYSVYAGNPGFIIRSVKIERTKDAPEVPVEIKLVEGGKVILDEDFSKNEVKEGVPAGAKLFYSTKLKGVTPDAKVGIVQDAAGRKVLQLVDNCDKTGLGPYWDLPAVGGKKYRASVIARALPGRDSVGTVVQFNMKPGRRIGTLPRGRQLLTTHEITVPEKDTKVRVYIYSGYDPKPALEIIRIVVEELP